MRSAKMLYALFFTLLFLNQGESQVTEEWAVRKNGPGNLGDGAQSTAVDGSGNVYVTGHSMGIGSGDDYSTIKYNSSGVQQWEARYNGPGNSTDASYQVKVDVSGNVYVTGSSRSGATAGTEDFATIKYNSAGVQQWASRYNGTGNSTDAAYQIIVDISGNVYVTGTSSGSGTGNDYATIKYNSSGVQQWVQRYNGPGNSTDEAYRIAVSDSGNVYVTGYSRSGASAGTEDCTTIKYNSAGVQQWVQRFNNGANEIGLSVSVDASGNVYIAGFAWNGFSSIDYLTIKYNASGVQQWVNVQVQAGIGIAFSLAVDGAGNVYVTGYSWDEVSGNDDYLTIKYNSSGSFQWGTKYNGTGNGADTAYSLAIDGSGNVYVTGSSSGSGSGTDYATIKYNSSGVQQWVQRYNGLGNGRDAASSLAIDVSGKVYVTGLSAGSGTGDDFATIKYSQTGSLLTLNLTSFIEGFYNSVSNNMVSDSVRVYLKNISSPYNTIDSSKGKLSSSGTGALVFSNAVNGTNYYIVINHRNSIQTWSGSGVAFSAGILNYDFSNALNKAYGNNMKQADASPVRFAFYSGDVNQDGTVDASDNSLVDNAASISQSGYVNTDVTGDDFADAGDVSIVDNNAFNSVSVVTP